MSSQRVRQDWSNLAHNAGTKWKRPAQSLPVLSSISKGSIRPMSQPQWFSFLERKEPSWIQGVELYTQKPLLLKGISGPPKRGHRWWSKTQKNASSSQTSTIHPLCLERRGPLQSPDWSVSMWISLHRQPVGLHRNIPAQCCVGTPHKARKHSPSMVLE